MRKHDLVINYFRDEIEWKNLQSEAEIPETHKVSFFLNLSSYFSNGKINFVAKSPYANFSFSRKSHILKDRH